MKPRQPAAFKSLIIIITSALLIFGLSGCQSESQTNSTQDNTQQKVIAGSDIENQIDEIFSDFDVSNNRPGASVAVVKNGQVVFKKGYGLANLEYDIPVTPSTVFHIASVSKQFTVFSILLLAEEGKLDFDDDVRKYIPEIPDFGETITLRHLAAHTSGMRDQWNLLVMAGWRFDDVITLEHIMKLVTKQKELNFSPGEEFLYSNTGFTLLAEVVARVSEQSFAEFTQNRIFKPLGMTNTLFYDDHQKIVKNRAYSYSPVDDGFQKSVLSYANVGATSLFTTVEDLSLWAVNFDTNTVGSESLVNTMNALAVLNNGETFGGAYGQFISEHKGLQYIQHGGADAGYRTYFARFPEQDIAVSVFSNVSSANTRTLAMNVADVFLTDYIQPDEQITENLDEPSTEVNFITLSEQELAQFEGHYWNEEEFYSRQMYVNDGVLMYSRGGEDESPLAPVAQNRFKMLEVDVDLFVEFDISDEERVMKVTVDQDEPVFSIGYEPRELSEQVLQEYAGTYFSDELQTSYDLIANDESLTVTHYRHSDVEITPVKDDNFTSETWILRNVVFERDDNNIVTGMRVSNGRVRNLHFARRSFN